MTSLLQHIKDRSQVSPELEDQLRLLFEKVELAKGETILREGKRADYLYFVERGTVHNYYYHGDRKATSWFYDEGSFVTAWHSFYTQRPSFEEIECLEDCILYRISYTNYQVLVNQQPAFGHFARILAEEMLVFIDEFSKGWSFLSAREKYALILKHFPDIELRVKLGLIASFLGISQETLSRLRAKK